LGGARSESQSANFRARLLGRVAVFCARHPFLVMGVYVPLLVLSAHVSANLDVRLAFTDIIDPDTPEMKMIDYAVENFGGMDLTFVALTGDDIDQARALADELKKRLLEHPEYISWVLDRMNVDFFKRHALLYLDESELDDFEQLLTDFNPELSTLLASGSAESAILHLSELLDKLVLEGEFEGEGDLEPAAEALEQLVGGLGDWVDSGDASHVARSFRKLFLEDDELYEDEQGYLVSDDGKTLLVLIKATKPADDYIFCRQTAELIEGILKDLELRYPGVESRLAGNLPVMRDEHVYIIRDMWFTTIVTFIGVLLIFFVFFRRISDLFLVAVPLGVTMLFTFTTVDFAIGYLSITTAFFGAVLLGLGVDFSIHVVARYSEERLRGAEFYDAIWAAAAKSGPAILTGGATTACAFFSLMFARFEGIAQLGFVAGMGIVWCIVIIFTLLSALIAIRDRFIIKGRLGRGPEWLPLGAVAKVILKHPKTLGLAIVLATAILGAASIGLKFNYDFRSLEPKGMPSIENIIFIEESFGWGLDYGMIVTHSLDEDREKARRLSELKTAKEVQAISDYIPEDQGVKLAVVSRLKGKLLSLKPPSGTASSVPQDFTESLERLKRSIHALVQVAVLIGDTSSEDMLRSVRDELEALIGRTGKNPPSDEGFRSLDRAIADELNGAVDDLHSFTEAKPIDLEALPEEVGLYHVGKDGNFLVYAYPSQYIWEERFMKLWVADLKSVDEDAMGVAVLFLKIMQDIMRDFKWATVLAFCVIIVLLLLDFRRLSYAFLALLPLGFGSLWMLGIMRVLGIDLNYMNVACVPLILGIGVDYGVHVLHRYKAETEDRIRNAVEHTGRAIFLSSVTTMTGFGAIGLVSFVGLASLGQVLFFGVLLCFVASVTVLPLALLIRERIMQRRATR